MTATADAPALLFERLGLSDHATCDFPGCPFGATRRSTHFDRFGDDVDASAGPVTICGHCYQRLLQWCLFAELIATAEVIYPETTDSPTWEEIEETEWFQEAQALADGQSFFHWWLEFPEVFVDLGIDTESGDLMLMSRDGPTTGGVGR